MVYAGTKSEGSSGKTIELFKFLFQDYEYSNENILGLNFGMTTARPFSGFQFGSTTVRPMIGFNGFLTPKPTATVTTPKAETITVNNLNRNDFFKSYSN